MQGRRGDNRGALPIGYGKLAKSESAFSGVNDQGTELFSHVVQELVGFGVLAQQPF